MGLALPGHALFRAIDRPSLELRLAADTVDAAEMLDDLDASGDDDVCALHVIADYLAGRGALESAVHEFHSLDAKDTSAEYTDDTFGEEPDAVLLRALRDDSLDTA